MPVLFLNREDVESLLPYGECIEVMAGALSALARNAENLQPIGSLVSVELVGGNASASRR